METSTASAEPKHRMFRAQEPAGLPGPCCHFPIPNLPPSGRYLDFTSKTVRDGWVGRLESKLRARSGSLHPRCRVSGLLAQVQSTQTGFGSGLSWWDLTKTRALPKPPA